MMVLLKAVSVDLMRSRRLRGSVGQGSSLSSSFNSENHLYLVIRLGTYINQSNIN